MSEPIKPALTPEEWAEAAIEPRPQWQGDERTIADLERLIREDGEACLAVEKKPA